MSDDATPADYLEKARQELAEWKSKPPSVVGKAVSTLLTPVSWLVSKVIPPTAVHGILQGLHFVAKHTLSAAGSPHFEDLRECDRRAAQVVNFHIGTATVEGGAAGLLGLPAIPADVAALLTLSMRLIRQIGVEYGYDDDNEAEQRFCFSIMQGASANTVEEKLAAQFVLAELGNVIAQKTWKEMAAQAAGNLLSKEAAATALRQLAKQVGINLTKRKALEFIPVVGLIVGAASNGWFLKDIGISAEMAYRERWLNERFPSVDSKAEAA